MSSPVNDHDALSITSTVRPLLPSLELRPNPVEQQLRQHTRALIFMMSIWYTKDGGLDSQTTGTQCEAILTHRTDKKTHRKAGPQSIEVGSETAHSSPIRLGDTEGLRVCAEYYEDSEESASAAPNALHNFPFCEILDELRNLHIELCAMHVYVQALEGILRKLDISIPRPPAADEGLEAVYKDWDPPLLEGMRARWKLQ
ncbi:hypothetical protein HETIRDRAFT_119479 [Heterobasidion irregulare TC 32-1]|uniref:Uncharacterized protein n=1 Tax=Heterobasidion irregulare (strain TC 32-1) TaxID=747525 RepID=W4KDG4_HETIT|nr:uncharacterized protein HETIRDRAFT_119479 [Heterobasidion irregulare TC 32-1]ETW83355.1 hypothetical protein HETIRDRAFT_119479 [Heterobasidion irregulare TC 32-1]